MADVDLKKLDRAELLELLIAVSKENEELRRRIEEQDKLLADRSIAISNSGSIAEAALQLSGIFDAAQAAADQYLENVVKHNQFCSGLVDDSKAEAAKIIAEAELRAAKLENETKAKVASCWIEAKEHVKRFYSMTLGPEKAEQVLEEFQNKFDS